MLTDVPQINQKDFKTLVRTAIRCGTNILIIGPSGGGKTLIAKEVADEENSDLIYINLAVLERTDFQGFPVLSEDKSMVSYATPDYLPFSDSKFKIDIKKLEDLKLLVADNPTVMREIDAKITDLKNKQYLASVASAKSMIETERFKAEIEKIVSSKSGASDRPITFLFDEADKAATETTQTLLELLQFGSINGRKLNVKACILTGNLPDEHAHVSQISHAITKRCSTYVMNIDFQVWREWAFKNGVHDHIVQFLSNEPGLLYKKAPDGDVTAYALPSPRTWVMASDMIHKMESDDYFRKMPDHKLDELKMTIIAGNVGDTAAAKYRAWYNHYRKWDPAIQELIEQGKHPDFSNAGSAEQLIVAIAACSKVYAELKPNNEKKIKQIAKNVYSWLVTQPDDIAHGSIRISFGGDFKSAYTYGLSKIPEAIAAFKKIQETLDSYEEK